MREYLVDDRLVLDRGNDPGLMLSRRLKKKGYDIVAAMDGQQAVTMAVELQPDLILMDLYLPVINGWEASRQIKATQSTTTIIALTGHDMHEDRKLALDAGCDDLDSKPIETRLLEKKSRLLNNSDLPAPLYT